MDGARLRDGPPRAVRSRRLPNVGGAPAVVAVGTESIVYSRRPTRKTIGHLRSHWDKKQPGLCVLLACMSVCVVWMYWGLAIGGWLVGWLMWCFFRPPAYVLVRLSARLCVERFLRVSPSRRVRGE